MSAVHRIAKNTIILLVADFISKSFSFFSNMYVARYLGIEGYGVLSFVFAFVGIFSIFTDIGLSTLTTREVARNKSFANKYLTNVTFMKIVLSVITFGLIILTINTLSYPKQIIQVTYIASIAMITGSFAGTFSAIFRAYEKMTYLSIVQISSSILMLGGVLLVIFYQFSIFWIISISLIISIISLSAFLVLYLKYFTKLKIEYDWSFCKNALKESWPMGAVAICVMLYFRIDTVMLSLMKDETAVGLYSAAYRLSEMTTVIPGILMASVFPVMAQYFNSSKDSFNLAYNKSVKYLLYLALPMALIVTLLAEPIINLVYGAQFAGSIGALQVLIWASAIMYVTMTIGTTIVTANRQIFHLKLALIATALNIILNLIFIPRYGYIGASATTMVTEFYGLVVGIFFLHRWGYKLNTINVFSPAILAFIASVIGAIILVKMGVNIFVTSIIALVIYGLIIYAKGIKEDDRKLIQSTLNFLRGKS